MNMRTKRRTMQNLFAIALMACTVPSSGQDQSPLAVLSDRGTSATFEGDIAPRNGRPERAPITDDGRTGDARVPTSQLLISFTETETVSLNVEIMDEAGRCVQQLAFTSHEGRNMLPIDVTGLAQGRYAVRVQGGGATTISRFERD